MTTGQVVSATVGPPRTTGMLEPDGATGPTLASMLAMGALFGVAFAAPTLVSDFTPTDVAIGGLLAILVAALAAGHARVDREVRLLFPGLALVGVGTLLGATHVGLQSWILGDLVRDVGAFASLFAMVSALRAMPWPQLERARWAVVGGMSVLTLQLLLDGGGAERASATFPNPNVPGHYLATAIGLCAWTLRGRARVAVVVVGLVGLAATGSFGGALQVVAMGAFVVVSRRTEVARRVRRRPALAAAAVVAVLASGLLYTTVAAASSPDRLDRSGSQRFELWQDTVAVARDRPLGVGPGTIKQLDLLNLGREPHSEYFAYLGERGVVGLVGLVALGVGLFRLGRRAGGLRMLLVGLAVASVFRETIHYRHLWLFLAFVLVWDQRRPDGTGPPAHRRDTVPAQDRRSDRHALPA